MDKKISYWVELALYDLETASAMLESKRYLYLITTEAQLLPQSFRT